MVSMLVFSGEKKELDLIKNISREIAARETDDRWEIACFSVMQEIRDFITKKPLIDMACYDVTVPESIDELGKIRSDYRETVLMLITDRTLSPMDYVRPDILASSLIIRPYEAETLKVRLYEMINNYLQNRMNPGQEEEVLTINSHQGKIRIPYRQIYYIEARNKKIFVRLKTKEIAFYATIEELEEKLPDSFMRCHRGFIINKIYIERIMLSQGEIIMAHGIRVPLSRSYKPLFKAMK